jgi:hypothetical protein
MGRTVGAARVTTSVRLFFEIVQSWGVIDSGGCDSYQALPDVELRYGRAADTTHLVRFCR